MRQSLRIGVHLCGAIGMVVSIATLGRVVGWASPWFALMACFCVLGVLDLALPFVQTRMPTFLRRVRSWEISGAIYRAMGVQVFGEILRRTPLRLLNRRVYLKRSLRDLSALRTQLKNAEAAHFWGGVATIPYLAIAWIQGWRDAFISIVFFNLIVNLYPILHLRTVRGRIDEPTNNRRSRHLSLNDMNKRE